MVSYGGDKAQNWEKKEKKGKKKEEKRKRREKKTKKLFFFILCKTMKLFSQFCAWQEYRTQVSLVSQCSVVTKTKHFVQQKCIISEDSCRAQNWVEKKQEERNKKEEREKVLLFSQCFCCAQNKTFFCL